MIDEEKTITANEPAAEKQTKPTKPKRTDEEKLHECYERRDRLREQKTAHKNKGQVIDKSIAENNAKIAEPNLKKRRKAVDKDERFRLSNKMNDIAKTVNTEKAIYDKDVEEAERVINDLGEFVRNGIIPLPLREVEF